MPFHVRLDRFSRAVQAGLALVLVALFGVAWWLRPTDERGEPLRLGAHEQLGLPPCTFYQVTRLPCPSCGLTTSFAHFAHGDPANAWRANPSGLLLAAAALAAIPWLLCMAFRGRKALVYDFDRLILWGLLGVVVLLMGTWIIRIVLA